MSASLKRRRTSQDTYVAVNSPDRNGQASTSTPTPKRASYLSPTKASLARSNPLLLETSASAKKSRESEPNRRQSLLDAVLGNRSLPPADDEQTRQDLQNATSTEIGSTENVSPKVQNNASVRVKEKENENEIPNTPRHRDSERSSQQTRRNSTPRRTGRSTRFASPKIVPQLVDSPRRESRRSASAEVDLPPTPVQLGKDKLPDRPRGLSSSSPGGRNKNRATIRGGNIQSSPLKPRQMAPIHSEDEDDIVDDVEVASGLGEDEQDGVPITDDAVHTTDINAGVSDVDVDTAASDMQAARDKTLATTNPDMVEKNQKLESLQAELQSLEEESRKLKDFSARLNQKKHNMDLESLQKNFYLVLQKADHNELASSLPTDQNPLFRKHASSYLNVFTDPALTMSYDTWEDTKGGRQKFVYQTTFVASQPWPADTFAVTLETRVDWDTDVVENVALSYMTKQPELSKWFHSRQEDVILGCDAATLVNGTRNFLEASIKRARIWRDLIEPQVSTNGNDPHLDEERSKYSIISREEAVSLLPYLFQTQHGFASPNAGQKQTRRSLGSAKQLMLTYEISLDWLGQPEVKTDILMTGFNSETVDAAQQLYRQVELVGGIVKALNGVRDILGMSANASTTNADPTGAMRTKKGKARRMTIFN